MTSAFLKVRPAATPGAVWRKDTRDFVRLFELDRRPGGRPRLVCRWQRGCDGRLSCIWERDTTPLPRPLLSQG